MQAKTKDSYNTDYIAQKLAQAALEDQVYAKKILELCEVTKKQYLKML